eukprot:CAMPEP_0185598910 /NCGR_PEP_ID=MMETSP0434-20130131/82321_1 /TAXON_ID=626734 ORGANISM="Favella taraikaensis, Strain Fe Narragansett Bay" /NCGR_SAMPLE_ID=MMETSP0434 /ASSEMBLY_ACC=CAM_ASM_000379 /LENGTH=52 /DNA_ID=CAMNT_0028228075 /DNA_START=236 /DNA_END=394 /DNA_ORIENTATION=+
MVAKKKAKKTGASKGKTVKVAKNKGDEFKATLKMGKLAQNDDLVDLEPAIDH